MKIGICEFELCEMGVWRISTCIRKRLSMNFKPKLFGYMYMRLYKAPTIWPLARP